MTWAVETQWFCLTLLLMCGTVAGVGGGVESNLCCQVGTVPVVLVGGLAYRMLWSTKILSSCFSSCLWCDLWVSIGPQLWNDCEVFPSLSYTISSVPLSVYSFPAIPWLFRVIGLFLFCFVFILFLYVLLILLLILCIQLFLFSHCRQ